MVSLRFSALVSIFCAVVLVNVSSAQSPAYCTSCYKIIPAGCETKIANMGTSNATGIIAFRDCICTDIFLGNFDCLSCAVNPAITDNAPYIQTCKDKGYSVTIAPSTRGSASKTPSAGTSTSTGGSSATPSGTGSATTPTATGKTS
ncbi:hypothetical protein K493DRAFT_313899, partial [Basidiobolus meristosporus CBS 931.73]